MVSLDLSDKDYKELAGKIKSAVTAGIQDVSDRSIRNETKIIGIEERMARFDANCLNVQERISNELSEVGDRVDKFVNHEVHALRVEIKEAKEIRRKALSRSDWVKIIVAAIAASGVVAAAIIQMVL